MPTPVQESAHNIVSHEAGAASRMIVAEQKGFSLMGAVSKLTGIVSMAVMLTPMLGGGMNWLSQRKSLSGVAPHLQKAGAVAQLTNVAVGDLPQEMANVLGRNNAATVAVTGAGGRVGDYAKKTLGTNLHGRLAETSVSNMLFAGTMAVGEAANTALTFKARIQAIKAMQMDLTGKTPSTLSIVFGGAKLHPLVQQARKEALGKRALFATLLSVGGTVGNIAMMFSRETGFKYMAKSVGITMGTSMLASGMTSGDTALASYRDMSASFALSGKAGIDSYVGLIGGLSKGTNYQLVEQVAQKAHAKQMKPQEVLKMMAETSFLKQPPAAQQPQKQALGKYTGDELARRAVAGKGASLTTA